MALGVRGSTPAPGGDFVQYGGHTSCVAVFRGTARTPDLILDAGTGLSTLPALLGDAPFRGTIVLSHLHWDHVQGLPFCRAVDRPDAAVTLHIPADGSDSDADAYALLARSLSPPHFPITPDGLRGDWTFRALHPGVLGDGISVAPVAHKGGIAFAIRVTDGSGDLAYVPDHALHAGTDSDHWQAAARFVQGADVLMHDGQFTAAETETAAAYGHAAIETLLDFADASVVGTLVITHHAPTRTDAALDQLAARFRRTPGGRSVIFARQGVEICVG